MDPVFPGLHTSSHLHTHLLSGEVEVFSSYMDRMGVSNRETHHHARSDGSERSESFGSERGERSIGSSLLGVASNKHLFSNTSAQLYRSPTWRLLRT